MFKHHLATQEPLNKLSKELGRGSSKGPDVGDQVITNFPNRIKNQTNPTSFLTKVDERVIAKKTIGIKRGRRGRKRTLYLIKITREDFQTGDKRITWAWIGKDMLKWWPGKNEHKTKNKKTSSSHQSGMDQQGHSHQQTITNSMVKNPNYPAGPSKEQRWQQRKS